MRQAPQKPQYATGVIYARYSSHAQRDVSIEQQVDDCRAFAAANNIEVVEVYADRHLTGTTDRRPEFQRLMSDAQKRKWDYVITWKVDRFARNRYDSATYKARLKKYGVKVLYAREPIPDGPEGILLESVLEGSAEYYSANLSQNVRRGLRYNAENCLSNGGSTPLGYKVGPDKRYEIDPGGAAVVKEIFERADAGMPLIEIAASLNARGIRTTRGGDWNKSSFDFMLHNERYIGTYTYDGMKIENGMPAIISKEVFYSVQDKMKNKGNPRGRARPNGAYLLTGKLYCGKCGSFMVGISGTSRTTGVHHYYSCNEQRTKKTCDKRPVRRDWIEREVAEATKATILQPEVMEWIADRALEYQESSQDDSLLRSLKAQLGEAELGIKNIMAAIEQGIITASTKERLLELESQKEHISCRISKESLALPKLTREQLMFFLESFSDGDVDDKGYREKLVDTFVRAVYLYDDEIKIVFNYTGKKNSVVRKIADIIDNSDPPAGSHKLCLAPPKNGCPAGATFFGAGDWF